MPDLLIRGIAAASIVVLLVATWYFFDRPLAGENIEWRDEE